MIKWKLRQIMFDHRITSKSLAKALDISENSMCYLRNCETLPELGSEKICKIAKCLSNLSGEKILPLDLLSCIDENRYKSSTEEIKAQA